MQKSVKCQADFLLVHKKLPGQLLIGPKKYCNVISKIKTAKSKHQIIHSANSSANSIKSIHQKQLQNAWYSYTALLLLWLYKIPWRFHQGWPKKNTFKDMSDMLTMCRLFSYWLYYCWLFYRALWVLHGAGLLLWLIPMFNILQNASVLFKSLI